MTDTHTTAPAPAPAEPDPAVPAHLLWIVGSEHTPALINAAEWLHANAPHAAQFGHRYDRHKPCEACWRAAAYAVQGVLMAGYQRRDRTLTEAANLVADVRDQQYRSLEFKAERHALNRAHAALLAARTTTAQEG